MDHSTFQDLIDQSGNNFTVSEFAVSGDQSQLQRSIVEQILLFRDWHGFPTYISSAYRHGDPRAHGMGLAIDQIMFYDYGKQSVDPIHQWELAQAWGGFKGVGIYFDWHYGDIPVVGLHLDTLNDSHRPARWLRITQDGRPLYFYKNWETGNFYNRDTQRTLSLKDAIKLFNDGNSDT